MTNPSNGDGLIPENENIIKNDNKFTQPHTADLGTRSRYRQEGAKAEQKRIIKIIKKRRDYDCSSALCKTHGLLCIYCQADNELIEIIKGER